MPIIILTDVANSTRRMGAYRIASALRSANQNVEVIDYLASWDFGTLIKMLDGFKDIPWIGISASYLTQERWECSGGNITDLPTDLEVRLMQYIRDRNVPIVIGGSNAEAIVNIVQNTHIIVGYADEAVIALHDYIVNGKPVKSSVLNSNIVIFADRDYANIDLQTIGTTYTKSDLLFVGNEHALPELMPIEISRGCIFRCAFCEFGHLGKKPGTYIRPKDEIKREIEQLYHEKNVDTFLFSDDTFNDTIDKMKMMRDIKQETGIPFKFWAYARLDLMVRFPEMVDLIGEIGMIGVTFGIETLDRKVGAKVGKGADPDRIKHTLLDIRKRYPEMHVQVNLIVGLPHSTKEEIKRSVDWLIDNDAATYIRAASLDIRDSSKSDTGSLFSKNPGKYGFQIISSDSIRYAWSHDTFTSESATEYRAELTEYIHSRKKNNAPFHSVYGTGVDAMIWKKQYLKRKQLHLRARALASLLH